MFDLFRSRQKAVRYVLGAVLTVVALSMVITLIPGFGTTSGTTTDTSTLAQIGDQKITAEQVQQELQQMVQAGRIPAETAEIYTPQFVDQMLLDRSLVYEFERLGVTVSDDEVLTGMQSQFSQFFQNGVLVSKDQLEATLAQQGMTLQDAIDLMRATLLERKVQNMLVATAVVSPQEVEAELVRKNEKAKIAYIAFPPAKFRGDIKPSDDELRAYFNAHRAQYKIPEKRSFQVVVVDQEKVEASLTVSDAQLRAAYAANMDNFRMGERVHVRHILIKTADKSDAEKKQLLAKAQDILKQLQNGADFATLAKKYSEDTNSAQKGGDLDWIAKDQTVPEVDKVLFSLRPKQLSDVITASYGYEIVQLLEKEPARVKPFEEVKAGLASDLKKEQVTDKMQTIGDQTHAALEKSPGSAAEVAKQFGADLVTVTNSSAGEAIPSLGVSPEIDNALAGMKKGDVSQVLVLPANRMAMVVLNDRVPSRPAEYNEVESQVREQYITDKAQAAAAAAAQDAAAKLKAGADMDKLAKSLKLDVTESTEFGRADSVEGLGSAVYVADAFTKPVGAIFGPVSVQGRDVVCKVLEKKSADPLQMAGDRPVVLEQLKEKKAGEEYSLFMDSIFTKLKAEGKVKLYPDAIKRLSTSFHQ